jgi:hypothetical protein
MRRWTPAILMLASSSARALPVQVSYEFDSTNATLSVTSPVAVSIPPSSMVRPRSTCSTWLRSST